MEPSQAYAAGMPIAPLACKVDRSHRTSELPSPSSGPHWMTVRPNQAARGCRSGRSVQITLTARRSAPARRLRRKTGFRFVIGLPRVFGLLVCKYKSSLRGCY